MPSCALTDIHIQFSCRAKRMEIETVDCLIRTGHVSHTSSTWLTPQIPAAHVSRAACQAWTTSLEHTVVMLANPRTALTLCMAGGTTSWSQGDAFSTNTGPHASLFANCIHKTPWMAQRMLAVDRKLLWMSELFWCEKRLGTSKGELQKALGCDKPASSKAAKPECKCC